MLRRVILKDRYLLRQKLNNNSVLNKYSKPVVDYNMDDNWKKIIRKIYNQ